MSSSDVVRQNDDVVHNRRRSLTSPLVVPVPPSSAVERSPTAGGLTVDEISKLPVNWKLNGVVPQFDDAPLDLSISGGRAAADSRPEVISADSWRVRSGNSPPAAALTSASLAKLVRRFGTTRGAASSALVDHRESAVSRSVAASPWNSLLSPTGAPPPTEESSVKAAVPTQCVGGAASGRGEHAASLSRSVAIASQSTSLQFTPPARALCSPPPPPSRWRRDSFWASGGWLQPDATTPALLGRKRPPVAPTNGDERRQGAKSSRKQFSTSDHRKSSHQRAATRLRCDERSLKMPPRAQDSSMKMTVPPQCGEGSQGKKPSATPSSPKRPRTDSDGETGEDKTRQRQDADDPIPPAAAAAAAASVPAASRGACKLTSPRCGSCGAQFDSLYRLTVHLEQSAHLPASDVATPATHAAEDSPSSSTPPPGPGTAPAAPQRLVRGQDVWLARGVEQTDRILRCIQCNAPARSLAELTLHMVHTRHYINIVGPPTANSSSSSSGAAVFHKAPVDRLKNGLISTRSPPVINTNNDSRRHDNERSSSSSSTGALRTPESSVKMTVSAQCVDDGPDDRTLSQRRSSAHVQGSVGRALDTDKHEAGLYSDGQDSICSRRLNDGQRLRRGSSSARAAAFSVRNLIASETTHDEGSPSRSPSPPRSPAASPMTSSVGPEVTSSSDDRRRRALVAE